MPPNEKPGSIFSRNKEDCIEAEALLWRALCDKPKAIHKYLTDDAVLAESDNKLYSPKTEPTLKDYIDDHYEAWTSYKMHDDPEFVEIDMMSGSLIYRVTAYRQDEGGQMVPTEGLCSSIWRQEPGGEWRCCMHHMTAI